MPFQNTSACSTHISANATQPTAESPVKPWVCASAYGARPGQSFSATTTSDADAR